MVLAVFHSCYKFFRAHYFTSIPLWESVRQDLSEFAGLMIFSEIRLVASFEKTGLLQRRLQHRVWGLHSFLES